MTRRPHGWRIGLLALATMVAMLLFPVVQVAAQADPATQFSTVTAQLATLTPVAGPSSGTIDAANAATVSAGVSVTNGAVHAEFTVPDVPAGTLWAMAVLFRVADGAQNFLLVFPDGTWQLQNGQPGGGQIGSGVNFDTTAGATVALDVVFEGATGSFGINGAFVSGLDISAIQTAGDVALSGYLGLGSGTTTIGYSNFAVYDLSGAQPGPTATTGALGAPTETAVSGSTVEAGDPAALFQQYLAESMQAPKVYGPTSGAMVHDPQRVTFESTNVTVTDFAAHIECLAPRAAAELWDCGLAFRDTTSPEHYRLGVVSDGGWFLAIGSQPPIQQGTGLPIGQNAGDRVTLDLIVKGATGYLGVDGQFVAELDLSQLAGPGSVAGVVGFFDETFVPSGQTLYENFYVADLGGGAVIATETPAVAVPTETPVIGAPTEAPTVVLPPVESPTTGPAPTEAVPTVAPPVESPTSAPGAFLGVAGNTYTSPTFGYQLSWDATWQPQDSASNNGFDVFRLGNGVVVTDLYSGASSMTLTECVTSLVEYYQGNPSYTNVAIQPFADGQEIITQGNVAIATLTFDYDDGSGTGAVSTTDSVICAAMPTQGALVTMESYIPTDQVAVQTPAVRALEAQLVVDGAPLVLPAIPGATLPTPAVEPTTAPVETAVVAPTVAAGSSASVVLNPVGGSTVSGFGALSAGARSTTLSAILVGAEVGSAVGISRGTCAELGSVLDPDYYVGDVVEGGVVQGSAPVSLSVLLTRGPYAVVVYGPGEGAPMVACGEIVGA